MPNADIAKPTTDAQARRKATRARLIALRLAMPEAERRRADAAIEAALTELVARLRPQNLAFCWPYQGEFDARPLMRRLHEQGLGLALPVVADTDQPLEFHRWRPDCVMAAGRYGIAIPRERYPVVPDVILLPVNGFDAAGFRLGYGGGYFDRTLAALQPAPVSVGVGYELGRLASIRPEAHDARLDWLVTEAGIQAAASMSIE